MSTTYTLVSNGVVSHVVDDNHVGSTGLDGQWVSQRDAHPLAAVAVLSFDAHVLQAPSPVAATRATGPPDV